VMLNFESRNRLVGTRTDVVSRNELVKLNVESRNELVIMNLGRAFDY
jgi:hypothetical protein